MSRSTHRIPLLCGLLLAIPLFLGWPTPAGAQTTPPLPAQFLLNARYLPRVTDQGPTAACQAVALYQYQVAYQYNEHFGFAWDARVKPKAFSARFAYSFLTEGKYSGSSSAGEVDVARTVGVPYERYDPYGANPYGLSPYGTETRTQIPVAAYAHLIPLDIDSYLAFEDYGPGSGSEHAGADGIARFKALMVQHGAPGNLRFPIFPEWDAATAQHGAVGLPSASEVSRDGHAVTILGWDDNLAVRNGDGSVSYGAFIGVNQWGTAWGGTIDGRANDGHNGGYFAISYAFVARYATELAVFNLRWSSDPRN